MPFDPRDPSAAPPRRRRVRVRLLREMVIEVEGDGSPREIEERAVYALHEDLARRPVRREEVEADLLDPEHDAPVDLRVRR
jgi:hypothetical protein